MKLNWSLIQKQDDSPTQLETSTIEPHWSCVLLAGNKLQHKQECSREQSVCEDRRDMSSSRTKFTQLYKRKFPTLLAENKRHLKLDYSDLF